MADWNTNEAPATEGSDNWTDAGTQQNQNRNNRNYKRTHDSLEIKNFVGETPDFEGVLSLMTERVSKGIPFEKFQERLKTMF